MVTATRDLTDLTPEGIAKALEDDSYQSFTFGRIQLQLSIDYGHCTACGHSCTTYRLSTTRPVTYGDIAINYERTSDSLPSLIYAAKAVLTQYLTDPGA